MSRLLEDLNNLRTQIKKMRPKACCPKGIMHLANGNVELACAMDCPWQELNRLLANAMVDAEIELSK
jgi:hypothetical protein